MMNDIAGLAYVLSVVALFAKFSVLVSVQGVNRMRSRKFRYAEDALCWKGETARDEAEGIVRAQSVLRNDSEGQPYFLVLGALYVATGAWPAGAPWYFGLYVASRILHAVFLLRPRQPLRTRAFGMGLSILVLLAIHVVVAML